MASNELDKAIQNLITMTNKKIEITKVWENASPTSQFVAQTINIDLLEYDLILVEYKASRSLNYYNTIAIHNGEQAIMTYLSSAESNNYTVYASRIAEASATGVKFYSGYGKSITSSSSGDSVEVNIIPTRIYGAKGVI